MKGKVIDIINEIIYIVYISIYLVSLETYGMGDERSRVRYYVLAGAILVTLISWIIKNKPSFNWKNIKGKELLYTVLVGILFFIISVVKASKTNYDFNIRTLTQISLFMFPALYVCGLINVLGFEKIFRLMKITFFILLFAYFSETPHQIQNFFEFEKWKNVSFLKSTSFTESHICSEAFLQLFLYFYYMQFKNAQEENGYKNAKIYMILSFIFTILSFKRLGILFAIFILIFGKIILKKEKEMPKGTIIFLAILFTILTYVYTKIMNREIFTNLNLMNITSGRNYILSLWKKYDFISFGYGSSMLLIGRYLEMDLVEIYLELNLFALFIFCFTLFKISGKKKYPLIIMTYELLNMLTASSLPYSLSWILFLIAICVSYMENNKRTTDNLIEKVEEN